jgi:ornithine cyclodeaminase/alanine dehydrogenase-like protein (mu-crystallin family)
MPVCEETHMSIPYLSEGDLEALGITTAEIIAALEHTIRESQQAQVWSAPKAVITPPDGRYIMATLAVMNDPPLVATKSLVLNPRNSDIGLPQINGLVTLLHGETGVPEAILDCNWVTAVRTAGLSALAAKYMARPDSASAGFVGTGVQARSHLQAFADMFPLQHIKIAGRGQANIDALADMARKLGLSAEVCDTPREAVEGVDLVVTSMTHTSIDGPFLDANWLQSGSFLTAVDLGGAWHRETFDALQHLCIDDLQQEAAMETKLADPDHVDGDLSGLINGTFEGRASNSDRAGFVFRGHALGDLAIAAFAYQKSRGG